MVILGLGTNLGYRLQNLRNAIAALKNHSNITVKKISPLYQSDAMVPENSPSNWNKPFYNCALACDTDLSPQSLLVEIKKIEQNLGRISQPRWAPRLIDIDILAWNKLVYQHPDITIPHIGLIERPFALWPLRDLVFDWQHPLTGKSIREYCASWGSIYSGNAPFHTKQILLRVDTPKIVGILNLTHNSFTDDGVYDSIDNAINRATELYQQGAEIIDIGAEATNPDAIPINADLQWQKLEPVIRELQSAWKNNAEAPLISVDTFSPIVASHAIALGVNWINDVTGMTNPQMRNIIAQSNVTIVMMHNLGIPPQRQNTLSSLQNPVIAIKQWLEDQMNLLYSMNISPERIILDTGIGFGKTPEQSFEVLCQIQKIQELNVKLLIGHSRKSVCTLLKHYSYPLRDIEASVISHYLAQKNIDYLRVHNVAAHVLALNAAYKLQVAPYE